MKNIRTVNWEDFEEDNSGRMGGRGRVYLGKCEEGNKILFEQDVVEYCNFARCFKDEVIGGQVEESHKYDEIPLSDQEYYDICDEVSANVYYIEYEDEKGNKIKDGQYLGIDCLFDSVKGGKYNGRERCSREEMMRIVMED